MIKLKYGCEQSYATCLTTEVTPNPQSSLIPSECIVQEEVNEDIYTQLEDIWTENDLTSLGNLCLSYTTIGGKKVVKNVLLKFEQKICELQERIIDLEERELCDFPLTGCGLDFSCLTDACNNNITTVKELFQALITKSCTP